ncbi:hypothetical protein G5I_02965 [Acromyrmex echinatior]|uniref:Uncharacterized protein n=1 Tax=Acromyrmex echinatior TaxID=103372 RepID=F4WBP6_ACREC|nr:hypothetical protein G5I_02965 [Acromyrmex echinatior]
MHPLEENIRSFSNVELVIGHDATRKRHLFAGTSSGSRQHTHCTLVAFMQIMEREEKEEIRKVQSKTQSETMHRDGMSARKSHLETPRPDTIRHDTTRHDTTRHDTTIYGSLERKVLIRSLIVMTYRE